MSKLRHLNFHKQPSAYGFSIIQKRQPFLSTKFKISRAVAFYAADRWVKIEYSEGGYRLYEPLYVPLDSYLPSEISMTSAGDWRDELSKNLLEKKKGKDEGGIRYEIPIKFPKMVRSIIGEGGPALKVTGYRKISLSGKSTWDSGLKNTATYKQSKFPNLHMEQESKFKITGTIGSKIQVDVDQDSKAMTDLENRIHLKYTGEEDEIIKNIEAGNTNLSLGGSQFVGYSGNVQGLFGIKAQAQVGNLDMTVIASQEKGSTEKTTFNAGAKPSQNIVRDYEYVERKFFWLAPPGSGYFQAGDSIGTFDLYVNENYDIQTDYHALVTVSPNSKPNLTSEEETRDEYKYHYFHRLDYTDYELYRKQFYVVLNRTLSRDVVLGAFMVIHHADGTVDTIGNTNYFPAPNPETPDTTLVLKLIWKDNADSTFTTWENQWRNVYSLGGTNINREGLEISIYRGVDGAEDPQNDSWQYKQKPYIEVLGLDAKDLSGSPKPDNIVDPEYVYLYSGVLIFPDSHPFSGAALDSVDRVNIIYKSNNATIIQQSTKYYLLIKTANRDVTYSLGHANIIEGSEVVKLNGRALQRGKDYNIIYELGQITFLNQDATDPNANITIDYEFAPFFMVEKKSLFGSRLEYSFSNNSKLGFTALYKGESSGEQKPRVGQEPSRNFVWDTDLSMAFEPQFMTDIAEAIPLVETEAPSSLNIQAEFAESMPNPNTKGEAYIDDFESSREYTDLSILRGSWTLGSKPGIDSLESLDPIPSRLRWYNPYDQIRLTDIWPQRQVKESENRTNIMELQYLPDSDSAWAALMRAMPQGLRDQTRTKFIEVWARKLNSANVIMNIELGRINEDANGDGILDTEDKNQDGVLDDDEDVGIDGISNAQEDSNKFWMPGDPHGDNWDYSDRYNYTRINGTENNREDPDRGRRPDTEDINGNGGLDRNDSYFSFGFNLDDPNYIVEETYKDGAPTGWKLYRIPIKDPQFYEEIGFPDWGQIEYARFWLQGKDTTTIQVAQFQLAGNKWEVSGIHAPRDSASADIPIIDIVHPDERFDISVKNTQENLDYESPPGVSGERDLTTGLRRKEQSLVLEFQNLRRGHTASAFRVLYSAEDYSNYEKMKMYVHGDTSIADGYTKFIFRMGQDSLNYYQFQTPARRGWDTQNEMFIDFAQITALKNYMQINFDSTGVPDTTAGNYAIRGDPRLTAIRYFGVAVEVDSSGPPGISGEIWIDELRLTNARDNTDWAARLAVTSKFADLFDFSASYQRQGADFRTLLEKRGSGAVTTQSSLRGGLSLHKFLPQSWGLNIPASASWANTLQLPRLKPGSDIVLPNELKDGQRTENTTTTFNVSESMNMKTDNWFIKATLNRLSGSYSSSYSESRSPAVPMSTTDRWNLKSKYDLSFKTPPKLSIFGWTKNIYALRKVSKSNLFLLPSTLTFEGNVNTQTRSTLSITGVLPSTYTRDFTFTTNAQYNPFSAMNYSYGFTSLRDIREGPHFKLSWNPNELKLGTEIDYRQNFSGSWRPMLLSFIDNRVSFTSNYSHNSDPQTHPDSTLTVNNRNTLTLDGSLDWQKIFGSGRKIGGGGRDMPKGPGSPGSDKGKDQPKQEGGDEGDKKKSPMPGGPVWMWLRFKDIFTGIQPIRGQFSRSKEFSRPGLIGEPTFLYKFGFVDDPGVSVKTGGSRIEIARKTYTDSYSLKSGVSPFKSISVDASYTRRTTTTKSTTEPTRSNSITFPDLTFNLIGLEKIGLINKIASSSTMKTGYSIKKDLKDNPDNGALTNRDITKAYKPLFSWSLNWKNGIRSTLEMDNSKSKSESLRPGSENTKLAKSSTLTFTLNYTFKAPKGINLPFLKKIKFDSNLSLGATVTKQNDKSENAKPGQPYTVDSDRSNFTFSTNVTYSFSSQISGGLKIGWTDTDDRKLRRKQHSRELGIWTEIRF